MIFLCPAGKFAEVAGKRMESGVQHASAESAFPCTAPDDNTELKGRFSAFCRGGKQIGPAAGCDTREHWCIGRSSLSIALVRFRSVISNFIFTNGLDFFAFSFLLCCAHFSVTFCLLPSPRGKIILGPLERSVYAELANARVHRSGKQLRRTVNIHNVSHRMH